MSNGQEAHSGTEMQPSREARQMAMLAHLLAIFTSFIGPLVIYLVKSEEDRFVAFHSRQALYFELLAIPLAVITCGIWGVVVLIYNIIACIRANDGEWYEYPIVGEWARK
jgi:uncharacterized Tic20 family protein